MACGACGARKGATATEVLITYRDGSTERVTDTTMAKRKIALKGGGTYQSVAKQTE